MITLKEIGYTGRLGNQMFMFATAFAVAKEKGYTLGIFEDNMKIWKGDGCLDLGTNEWIPYVCELDKFKISCHLISCHLTYKWEPKHQYTETSFNFQPEIFNIKDDTNLSGYFQSYKYFDKYREEIIEEFTPKRDTGWVGKDKYDGLISLHVRRGDYVGHPGFPTIDQTYIIKALKEVEFANHRLVIFSDDINWCKQMFANDERITFFSNTNDTTVDAVTELWLMSQCDHNIISNSSYSWWAAYLNANPNKKVIAPKKWFADDRDTTDLCPPDWIRI